jgi:hypothetical protein
VRLRPRRLSLIHLSEGPNPNAVYLTAKGKSGDVAVSDMENSPDFALGGVGAMFATLSGGIRHPAGYLEINCLFERG